jgi:hypothetical protein
LGESGGRSGGPSSLLAGKRAGNFSFFGLKQEKSSPKDQAFQSPAQEFPVRGRREILRRSRENAQAMAAHESPRTTKLYDRTGDEITLDEVERITIQRIKSKERPAVLAP